MHASKTRAGEMAGRWKPMTDYLVMSRRKSQSAKEEVEEPCVFLNCEKMAQSEQYGPFQRVCSF